MWMLSKPLLAFIFIEDPRLVIPVNGAENCPGTDLGIWRHCCVYSFNSRYGSKANCKYRKINVEV